MACHKGATRKEILPIAGAHSRSTKHCLQSRRVSGNEGFGVLGLCRAGGIDEDGENVLALQGGKVGPQWLGDHAAAQQFGKQGHGVAQVANSRLPMTHMRAVGDALENWVKAAQNGFTVSCLFA